MSLKLPIFNVSEVSIAVGFNLVDIMYTYNSKHKHIIWDIKLIVA